MNENTVVKNHTLGFLVSSFAFVITLFVASFCAQSQNPSQSQQFIASPAKITAVSEHWPPFQIVERQQVIDGLSYDIVRAALKQAGMNADIQGHAWARSYKIAQQRPNILIFSIARNPQREKLFKWVGEIIAIDNSLWHIKGRSDIKINNLEDAKKFRLAVPRADVRHQYLTDHGFTSPKHLDVVSSNEQTLKMLMRGRTDLIVANKLVLANLVKKLKMDASQFIQVTTVNIHMGNLYVAFGPDSDDKLVDKLSKGLQQIKDNGTYNTLIEHWYKKLGPLGAQNTTASNKSTKVLKDE